MDRAHSSTGGQPRRGRARVSGGGTRGWARGWQRSAWLTPALSPKPNRVVGGRQPSRCADRGGGAGWVARWLAQVCPQRGCRERHLLDAHRALLGWLPPHELAVHPALRLARSAALCLLVLHQAIILLDVQKLGAVEAVLLRVLDLDDAHYTVGCLAGDLVGQWHKRSVGGDTGGSKASWRSVVGCCVLVVKKLVLPQLAVKAAGRPTLRSEGVQDV